MKIITKKICPVCNEYLVFKDRGMIEKSSFAHCKITSGSSFYFHYYQTMINGELTRLFLIPKKEDIRYDFQLRNNRLGIEMPVGFNCRLIPYTLDLNIEYNDLLEDLKHIKILL